MLHIILIILKIIGLIILALLGLLLLILFIVLFVPVRYRVSAEHGEELYVDGRASWLLHFFNTRFSYIKGKLHIQVKVLWFILYDNLKPGKIKLNGKAKKTSVKRNKISRKKKKNVIKEPDDVQAEKREAESKEELQSGTNIEQNQHGTDLDQVGNKNKEVSPVELTKNTQNIRIDEEKITSKDDPAKNILSGHKENIHKKESFFYRIIHRIKDYRNKVIAFYKGIKTRIIKWFNTMINLKNKINLVSDFIHDEINREGFRVTVTSLKKLLKHVKPTKLRSRIVFGTGDPCSTGQALGILGILYSFYGDSIQIIPDFENKILEGKHYARGRIRLITILIIVIKLILDKRFKRLKSNVQILKEAL